MVTSLAFTPDGELLATGSLDGTVMLWEVVTGKERAKLEAHPGPVRSVAFSPDGKTLSTAGGDNLLTPIRPGEVKVWDVATLQELTNLQGHSGAVTSVAFSPDGKMLATASWAIDAAGMALPGDVKLWDTTSWQEQITLIGHAAGVTYVAFSPDSKILATASYDRTTKLWDAATGQEQIALQGHTHWVTCLAFAPDGKTLATGSDDELVKIWDVTTGNALTSLKGNGGRITSVAFAPDGKTLVAALRARSHAVKDRLPSALQGLLPQGPDGGEVKLWVQKDVVATKKLQSDKHR